MKISHVTLTKCVTLSHGEGLTLIDALRAAVTALRDKPVDEDQKFAESLYAFVEAIDTFQPVHVTLEHTAESSVKVIGPGRF